MKNSKDDKLFDFLILKRKKKIEKIKLEIIYAVLEKIGQLENDEVFYTSKEVCTTYKISASTLERHIRKGLKFTNSGIKTKRIFTKSEVNKYFAKNML